MKIEDSHQHYFASLNSKHSISNQYGYSLKQGSAVTDKCKYAMCCIMVNVLKTNKVDYHCDKLATELS